MKPKGKQQQLPSRIAVVGNYLPRQCGIATFTTDLCEALAAEFPAITCFALPVNDTETGYDYPERVRFELAQNDLASYRSAAAFLNINNVDIVSVQHEYGIYGGQAGSHILALLRELRMPIVTTLHTILRQPDAVQRKALEEIAQLSDRLVVMSRRGAEFLEEIYRIPSTKIDMIPHGIPDVPFVDPNYYKDQFDAEGKRVLLTFGLLSPSKGIETVIKALPAILSEHPDVVYIVLGATHPHVKRRDGESYRLSLQRLASELGLENSARRHAIRKRAYLYGREMAWPKVARRYMECFERARAERIRRPRPTMTARRIQRRPRELPPLKLDHLRRLTDSTGILQHAFFIVPRYSEGYTTDDNARALIFTVLLEEAVQEFSGDVEMLASRYLGFLAYAFNEEAGRFRNLMSYDRRWMEETGSEDSHGRALWGLGTVIGRSQREGLRGLAAMLFSSALPATLELKSTRAWAFALLGIHEYLKSFSVDRAAQQAGEGLSERLMDMNRSVRGEGWEGFEPDLA